MQILTIAQIAQMKPGSPILAAGGQILSVSAYETGNEGGTPWSLQTVFIKDASGEMPVKVGNHDEIPATMVGQVRVFMATKRPSGGLSGLKYEVEQVQEGNQTINCPVLSLARSGRILTEEDYAAEMAKLPAGTVTAPVAAPVANPVQQSPAPTQGIDFAAAAAAQRQEPQPPAQQTAPTAKGKVGRMVEVRYERTVNTGNYCSEKMAVAIEPAEGVNPNDVVAACKAFLDKHLPPEFIPPGPRK